MTVKDLRTLVDNLDEYIHIPGGIDRLKKTVLHLAVSGKLVAQDHSEGTGEELYRLIQANREKLIVEGKLKKQKPLPEVTDDEIPFEIPASWKWVRPEQVGEINPRNHATDSELAGFIPMACISENYGEAPVYEERVWGEIKKNFTHFANGDVVMAKITPCFENSKAGIISGLPGSIGAGTTELHVFRQVPSLVVPEYFYLWVKSPTYLKIGQTKMTGSAGQKRVPTPFFKNFPMPLPPIDEQRRISEKVVGFLKLIDDLATKYKSEQADRSNFVKTSLSALAMRKDTLALKRLTEIIKTKEDINELSKTILHLSISGQLVPQDTAEGDGEELYHQIQKEKEKLVAEGKLKKQKPLPEITGDEIPFEIPKSWKWVRLGDISKFIDYRGKTPKKTASGVRLITAKNVRMGYIKKDPQEFIAEDNYESWMTRGFPEYGDVLFTTEAPLANAAIYTFSEPIALAQRIITIHPFTDAGQFLVLLICSPQFQEYILTKSTGTTVKGVKSSKLKEVCIPLPPLSEQVRIVQKSSRLLDLVSQLEKRLDN
jgi:type I restriction enzyme S subunit